MASINFSLIHGYKVGEDTLMDVVLREVIAGDVIEAQEESEKLVMVPTEKGQLQPELIPSPTLVGINVLRRQIVSIGNAKGPFDVYEIKKLHPVDLSLLQEKADELDSAVVAENSGQGVKNRGRDDQSGVDD